MFKSQHPFQGKTPWVASLVFLGPGCCSCPAFHLRLGASDCSPGLQAGLAFCFMGHGPLYICLDLLPATPLPPVHKQDAQHMFLLGKIPVTLYNHQKFPTSTAIQMGGVLQYKWEAYWDRDTKSTAIQIGGVLQYKLEVYCDTFLRSSGGWGF